MPACAFQALACPLDLQPLARRDGGWACPAGHSFDLAREGYLNLLAVQHKKSRDPGDSKAMVAARRRFLDAGGYAPIAAALAQALDEAGAVSCLDAGCGEGYYLRALADGPRELALLGLDISKWAIQAAARAQPDGAWVVGSNARLPVVDQSLDAVICAFGFPVFPEFARVLRPGGWLLRVDPGPEHLRQLREIIYPSLHPPRPRDPSAPGFRLRERRRLHYPLALDQPGLIQDLLAMTPHIHKAGAEGRARAERLERLALTVDVDLAILEPAPP